jgi:acyl carrier protein
MMLAQELKPYRPKSSHWSRTALISSAVALLALWKFSPFQISQWFYVAVLVFMALIVPAVSYVKGVVRHYRKQKEFNAAYTSKAKEIEQFIVELLKSNAGIVITDLHKPLAEYGLKSIDVALAVGELERYLEQDISPTCFYECKNIKELASYLALKSVEQSTLTNKESRPTATSARVQKTSPLNQRTAQPTSSAAYVLAMGKALPENYYPQQLSARALIESSTIPANQPEMVEKIVKFFTANGIEGRHMVLSLDELTKLGSTEHRNEYYVREAPKLATAAAREAIAVSTTIIDQSYCGSNAQN